MQDKIIIRGAREHNLQNVNLELPRNKMIVFTGLSGSGKSSLAFDTIFAEGQRRYVESLSAYARQFLGQMDKPAVDEIEGLSPAISIDQKAHSKNPRSTVATITEIYDYLRVLFARIGTPHCPQCQKEISKMTVEEMVDVSLRKLTGNKNKKQKNYLTVMAPVVRDRKGEYYQMLYDFYNEGFGEARIDGKIKSLRERVLLARHKKHTIELIIDKITLAYPLENNKALIARLAEAIELATKYGKGVVQTIFPDEQEITMSTEFSCPDCAFSFPEIEPRLFSFNSPQGACSYCSGLGTEFLFSENTCPNCQGARLKKESLCVLINNKNIAEVTAMTIGEADAFFKNVSLEGNRQNIAEPVLREIKNRLQFMVDVGLDYLTLDRRAGTLSGGEAQRIRLASQVGSRLVGALYILDEPTIGLHQRDNERLIKTLTDLRDLGNTVIVVEHDEDTIWAADYLVDLGPGAGKQGGKVICSGTMPEVLKEKSLTAEYLRGDKKIPLPEKRRNNLKHFVTIKKARENNLKNIDVKIPLKKLVAITGVSGSGKSTLTESILYRSLSNELNHANYKTGKHHSITGIKHLDKIIDVDQSPIGRTPRSNPATYTGIFTHIRDIFAATSEARRRGYNKGRFSFNRAGGRCENCEGNGFLKIEMHFLPDVFVPCTICKGTRFDRETLEVLYNGKNIAEILAMTVEDAYTFFKNIPPIKDRLKLLKEVGLGYIELGQNATTLSGGEAQRIKLSTELAKRATGRTMYVLDEPTVGLHFEDVKKLLEVLQKLVNKGNSVIIIEHNLDVIKSADHIIDLGPEGGDKGGEIVATGTPEEVMRNPRSYTGKYLRKILTQK